MSMKFDSTLKGLAGEYPRDFLAVFDQPPTGPVSLLNVDLSTFTALADLVKMNGVVNYSPRPGRGKMSFDYEIVSLWKRPVEELLAGALGTLPLAMLGKLPEGVDLVGGLTGIVQKMIARLEAEASAEQLKDLLTAAFVLTGLRVQRDVSRQVFAGVRAMRDSDTYMAILEEGCEKQARKDILRLGQKRLGPADEQTLARLQGTTDLERLERIHDCILEATSWEDLLGTP